MPLMTAGGKTKGVQTRGGGGHGADGDSVGLVMCASINLLSNKTEAGGFSV